MVEQNSRQVEQRDEEIRRIVESIAELQSIFKDLGNLVADQGTLLDRIDYNMEQTVVKVYLVQSTLPRLKVHVQGTLSRF